MAGSPGRYRPGRPCRGHVVSSEKAPSSAKASPVAEAAAGYGGAPSEAEDPPKTFSAADIAGIWPAAEGLSSDRMVGAKAR